MKQGEHVFDVNAEPEPEPELEGDSYPDFDADNEEGEGDQGNREHKDGCKASGFGKERWVEKMIKQEMNCDEMNLHHQSVKLQS